jgi:hypothetical protein
MFKKIWWCKCFNMEFLNWIVCCIMSYLNEGRHAQTKHGKRSHATLRCWKGNVLLLTCAKASKRKICWSTINLIVMTKMTKAQFLK